VREVEGIIAVFLLLQTKALFSRDTNIDYTLSARVVEVIFGHLQRLLCVELDRYSILKAKPIEQVVARDKPTLVRSYSEPGMVQAWQTAAV
jgi:hypothetical protein